MLIWPNASVSVNILKKGTRRVDMHIFSHLEIVQHLWEKKIPVFLPTPRVFCSAYSKVCIAIFGQTLFRSLSCIIEVRKNMHIDPPCSFFKNINRNTGIWPYQHLKIINKTKVLLPQKISFIRYTQNNLHQVHSK
jgi:hypothetical protein